MMNSLLGIPNRFDEQMKRTDLNPGVIFDSILSSKNDIGVGRFPLVQKLIGIVTSVSILPVNDDMQLFVDLSYSTILIPLPLENHESHAVSDFVSL